MIIQRLTQLGRTVRQVRRSREIFRVALKYGGSDLARHLHLPSLIRWPGKKARAEREAVAQLSGPERLRTACVELGPTFVKMGQVLSTRPSLLPRAYIRELAKLQEEVPPIPFAEVRSVLETELKRPLPEVFALVEEAPLGSASIAQVHRARLLDGREVVVKVQRPGISGTIQSDIEILCRLATLVETHVEDWRVFRPSAIIDELARRLEEETDFTTEAAHILRFERQFADDPTIHVPQVIHEASTCRLLTMEYIEGVHVFSDPVALAALGLDPVEIGRRIADLGLRQMFVHGFFHGDPHPGNIRILPGNVICFLDFGMMGFLDLRGREAFADLMWAISRRSEVGFANSLLKIAPAEHEPDRQVLEADAAEFMHRYFYLPSGEIEFGKLASQLLELTARHSLQMPGNFLTLLKSLSQIEGVVRRMNPQHDFFQQAKPIFAEARLQRFKSKQVTESLYEFGMEIAALARELPAEIRRILSQLKTGQSRMIFKHEGLGPHVDVLAKTGNRLTFGLVLAAMLIGSAQMAQARMPLQWHGIPIIGMLGFLISGVMGLWLLISILRHNRM
jgi:ubiquinone biosynthesis protein